ncbi:MAG: alpha/beta hydrolase [Myxococcaceae bacterium]|nr:alpha/beta hydrolase [Myxococcaceae bacterium]
MEHPLGARMLSSKADCIASKYECPSSRYMNLGGKRIHYCVEGRGPTLVLLHGALASLHTWEGWVTHLAAHYRIVRIDLPGCGLSDHLASDDYTPEHAVELVEQVRVFLGLERFYLAGSSLGGFFSWYYAAMHPERVEKLILIDPVGYPQKLPSFVSLVALPFVGELSRWVAPRFVVERSVRTAYGDPSSVSPAVIDRYHGLLLRGRNRAAMVKTFRQLRANNGDASLSRNIQRVTAPTLLMWGERDRWIPRSLIEAWRRDLPRATVVVYPGIGHIPMEEIPERTAWDAHDFLSSGKSSKQREQEPKERVTVEAIPFVYARGA